MPHLVEQVASGGDGGLTIAGRQQQGELTVAGPPADRSRHGRRPTDGAEVLNYPLDALHAAGHRHVLEAIHGYQQQAERTAGLPTRGSGRRYLAEKCRIDLAGRQRRRARGTTGSVLRPIGCCEAD